MIAKTAVQVCFIFHSIHGNLKVSEEEYFELWWKLTLVVSECDVFPESIQQMCVSFQQINICVWVLSEKAAKGKADLCGGTILIFNCIPQQ